MDRLRWDNIARAAAVLGVIALVVAWPHLRRHGPNLPSATATPVSVEEAPVVAPPKPAAAPAPARPKPRRRVVPRKRVRGVRQVRHREEGHPAGRRPAAPPPKPLAAPPERVAPPPPPPTPDDQAAREFAIP